MKETKFFSVIIPAYNAEKHIKRSVDSILKTGFLDLEIIIINDGSTDETETLCLEMAKKDSRIVYITQENGGPNIARNNALKYAKGKYILYLDADDEFSKDSMDILKLELESNNYDFINFGIRFINEKTKKITQVLSHKDIVLFEEEILSYTLKGNGILPVCWSKVINKDFLLKNNINFIPDTVHGRDIVFSRLLSLKAKKAKIISNVLVNSYETSNSFSRKYSIKNIESAIRVSNDSIKMFEEDKNNTPLLQYAIYKHLRYIGIISSFRSKDISLYIDSINLIKKNFSNIDVFKNCIRVKDYIFVLWLKFPRISFFMASTLNKFNIRPY